MHTVIFCPTKCYQALPIFNGASIMARNRKNFLLAMKNDRFSNLHSIILRETSTKKFDVALQSVSQAEARQNIYFLSCNQKLKAEDL